jgi:hypothetical protein
MRLGFSCPRANASRILYDEALVTAADDRIGFAIGGAAAARIPTKYMSMDGALTPVGCALRACGGRRRQIAQRLCVGRADDKLSDATCCLSLCLAGEKSHRILPLQHADFGPNLFVFHA